MPSLVIRGLSEDLHRALRARAASHSRSMTREAVSILERALLANGPVALPPPIPTEHAVPADLIDSAVEEGRE